MWCHAHGEGKVLKKRRKEEMETGGKIILICTPRRGFKHGSILLEGKREQKRMAPYGPSSSIIRISFY
jgi:hypothetical protein